MGKLNPWRVNSVLALTAGAVSLIYALFAYSYNALIKQWGLGQGQERPEPFRRKI